MTGFAVERDVAGLVAVGAWPGCEATEVGGAPAVVAAPPLTAAVKFLGATLGELLVVWLMTAGSLVEGPAANAAVLEELFPTAAVGAWAGRAGEATAGAIAGAGALVAGADVSGGASLATLTEAVAAVTAAAGLA